MKALIVLLCASAALGNKLSEVHILFEFYRDFNYFFLGKTILIFSKNNYAVWIFSPKIKILMLKNLFEFLEWFQTNSSSKRIRLRHLFRNRILLHSWPGQLPELLRLRLRWASRHLSSLQIWMSRRISLWYPFAFVSKSLKTTIILL